MRPKLMTPQIFGLAFCITTHFATLSTFEAQKATASPMMNLPDHPSGLMATAASRARLEQPALKQALMGALLYLDDTQIRERIGQHSPRFDACSGDGCGFEQPKGHGPFPLPLPGLDNRVGEWANDIHIFPSNSFSAPGLLKTAGISSLARIQDSNLFMTASTSYPLYLIDDSDLKSDQQISRTLRQTAITGVNQYRRGESYNFWPELPGDAGPAERVGPLNIPIKLGQAQQIITLIPGISDRIENQNFVEWSRDLFNPQLNPNGVDALANIPNDTDDTALAIAALTMDQLLDQGPGVDEAPLEAILQWRDTNRTTEDGRDSWKGHHSGGFLTWIKAENLSREERFNSPSSGVIPLGVNNVDCVVNANALFALGVSGLSESPAADDTSKLMERATMHRAWPECGLYYPQKMIFPYTLSRAFRDGGVRNPAMLTAMRRLLYDLLKDQDEVTRKDPKLKGAFSGGADLTYDLSTALGVASLLNIGSEIAAEADVLDSYNNALNLGVAYLLQNQQNAPIKFSDTFNRSGNRRGFPNFWDTSRHWKGGLFFSASKWSLAQWRSEAYTTAIVFEALAKFALAYDLHNQSLRDGVRLKVSRYARNAERAPWDFKVRGL